MIQVLVPLIEKKTLEVSRSTTHRDETWSRKPPISPLGSAALNTCDQVSYSEYGFGSRLAELINPRRRRTQPPCYAIDCVSKWPERSLGLKDQVQVFGSGAYLMNWDT